MSDTFIPVSDVPQRKSFALLFGLVLVLVLMSAESFWFYNNLATKGDPTPPLDDTYIYLQYAHNFAQGDLYEWLPEGGYTTGATSLLYVPVLAVFERLGVEPQNLFLMVFLLGALLWFASLLLIGQMLWGVYGRWPAHLGVLAAGTSGMTLWNIYSGMDAALLLFMSLLCFRQISKDLKGEHISGKGVLLVALLPLTRPEGIVLALMFSAWSYLFLKGKQGSGYRWPGLITLFIVLAMLSVNYTQTGTVRTNGMATKSWMTDPVLTFWESIHAVFGEIMVFLKRILWPFSGGWHHNLFLWSFFGAAYSAFRARNRDREKALLILMLALMVLLAIGLSFQSSYANVHRNRYQSAFMALALAMGVSWGAWRLSLSFPKIDRWLLPAFAFLLLWSGFRDVNAWALRYGVDARDIQRHPVAMGHWIKENVDPKQVVAVHDAGAMPFFSGHGRFLDLVGLGTNGMSRWYRSGPGSLFERIESLPEDERPDYYIIYPDWFENSDLHEEAPIHSITLKRWSIVPHPVKMVFRARNDVFDSAPSLWAPSFQDYQVLDIVDFADLESEAAHGFRDGGRPGPTSYLRGVKVDGTPAGDGCRWLQSEAEVSLRSPERVARGLIVRAAAPDGGTLDISVNGEPVGVLQLRTGNQLKEYWLALKSSIIGEDIRVQLNPGSTRLCQVGHLFLVDEPEKP